jgi:hypothetical protein
MFGAIYQFLLSLLTQILAFFGISFGKSLGGGSDAKDDSNADATASDAPVPPALEPLPMDHTNALASAQ